MRVALRDRSRYTSDLATFCEIHKTVLSGDPPLAKLQGMMLRFENKLKAEGQSSSDIRKTTKRALELEQIDDDELLEISQQPKRFANDRRFNRHESTNYPYKSARPHNDYSGNRSERRMYQKWNKGETDREHVKQEKVLHCRRCTSSRHGDEDCPFISCRCYQCKQLGHPARICSASMDAPDKKEVSVKLTPEPLEVNSICANDPRMVKLSMCRTRFIGKIDSGADVNTIPERIFQSMLEKGRLDMEKLNPNSDEIQLKTYDGTKLKVVCSFTAILKTEEFEKPSVKAKFFVVAEPKEKKNDSAYKHGNINQNEFASSR